MVGHNAHNRQPFQLEAWCLDGALYLKNSPWDVFNKMQQLAVKVSARSWSVLLSWLKHVLQVMSKAPSNFYTHISATLTTQPSYTPLHPSSTPLPTHVSTLYSFPSFQCRLSFLYRESPPKKQQQLHSLQNKEQQQANHYLYIYLCVRVWQITRHVCVSRGDVADDLVQDKETNGQKVTNATNDFVFVAAEWINQLMHWYWFLCSCMYTYATSMKDGGVVTAKQYISNWLGRRSAGTALKMLKAHGDTAICNCSETKMIDCHLVCEHPWWW